MSNYRRAYVPGACWFFTVVTHGRHPILADPDALALLRRAFQRVMQTRPFTIDAMVVLPDHIHCLWRLPEGDTDFSTRWMLIKKHFSTASASPVNARREKSLWQRRFWEHLVRDEEDWRRHVDYIHYNPVKHGYVTRPVDWSHGSFAKAVQAGWYPDDWGSAEPTTINGMEQE